MKIPRIIHEDVFKNAKNDMFLSYLASDYHQIEKTPGRKACQEVK
ncbi:hypothetical protein LEP1GSC036_3103 [Leptospira weilii str. 2006001853]|uniref:Uncharacterized protein n=3 Tax=Leptospira weilii TaxID=28184 RepID=A0A828YX63_9LEPT|nr:hypothetical protein LEP1GSC036_3103 [Leptospira weilii str. 2006001853]EMJ66033.1 hypothetical protein LEP1GSC051_3514 [Leptospira sp. P2653]EMN43573.1 hypothetical protein LEP1GSC086_0543 [Leptospira weilii str. LNT 1234]EMN91050.1 hypothetical protein LEP1GSC108_4275 [Leptospira weilii str. UI 13098]EMY13800.1 hypothetical protein LEP1GSC043_2254 [Leptospira weilii str. Ecochallenge]